VCVCVCVCVWGGGGGGFWGVGIKKEKFQNKNHIGIKKVGKNNGVTHSNRPG